MKQRSLVFQVDTVPYPVRVLVSIGQSDQQFKKTVTDFVGEQEAIKRKHKNFEKTDEDTAAYILQFDTGDVAVRLYSFPKDAEDFALLQHEIYHVIHGIMRHVNMRPTKATEEAYAYLTQHVTEQIYKKVLSLHRN